MVALKEPFICPSCGGPLRPPEVRDAPRPPLLVAGAGGGVLVILAALLFWPGGGTAPPKPAPPPAAKPAAPPPAPVPPPAAAPPGPAATPAVIGSSSPAGPTTVTLVPPVAPAGPPTAAAPLTPSAPKIDSSPPVGVTDSTMQANPPPPPTEIEPAPAPRRHRVVASARGSARAPAAPDMQALDGSQPAYPDSYDDTNRTGEVVVTCFIQLDGRATNCRVVQQSGGPAFASSVLDWLARDTTRFKPLQKHGRAVAGPFTWSVSFLPA
jgi:TonB family protein